MSNSDNFYDKQAHDDSLKAQQVFDQKLDQLLDAKSKLKRPATLNEIGRESLKTSAEKGFDTVEPSDWHIHGEPDTWQRLLVPTKLALIHSEVSEALEEFRKGHNLEAFAGELADIIIRVGQLGVGLGIDLDAAVAAKQEKNRNREHQHGGRLI